MTIALTLHDTDVFAAQIHARYPEGLTGLFAIGATRRTYILERQRDQARPRIAATRTPAMASPRPVRARRIQRKQPGTVRTR